MSKFIVFEGMDGTGKTTISKRIKTWLLDNGYKVLLTKEPGGTPIGNKIRDIVLYNTSVNELTDILLFITSRNELIHRKIKPSLEKDIIVLCDRYVYSSLVYQGIMNNNFEQVYNLHKQFNLLLHPDLLLIFKSDPDVCVRRLSNGDKFEIHDKEYFEKVQKCYVNDIVNMIKEDNVKTKVEIIDANLDEDKVFDITLEKIKNMISK